jgi:pilus assembly protein CpaE
LTLPAMPYSRLTSYGQARVSSWTDREPFAAFVCDDQTADLLRPVAIERGWPPEQVHKGCLRNAIQTLAVTRSPDILLIDLSESSDPLLDIDTLAEVCEPGTMVIAVGEVDDVRISRGLLASGVYDYLLKPFSADQAREAFAQAQLAQADARMSVEASARQHSMTAVIGVRGGVGASAIATSLGWLLGENEGRSTALLDLDLHFGTAALAFDLEPGRGLTDAIENPSRIDGLFIERAMVRASEKLSVLSAEAPLNQSLLSDGSSFYRLQEELKLAFDMTVLDLPRNMLLQYPHLLHVAQSVVLVVELTLACARDTIRILGRIQSNVPDVRVTVVANRVDTGFAEISRKEFEDTIERKVDLAIPYDAKTFAAAAKIGMSVAQVAKSNKTAAPLVELARHIRALSDPPAQPVCSSPQLGLRWVTATLARFPIRQKLAMSSFFSFRAAKIAGRRDRNFPKAGIGSPWRRIAGIFHASRAVRVSLIAALILIAAIDAMARLGDQLRSTFNNAQESPYNQHR